MKSIMTIVLGLTIMLLAVTMSASGPGPCSANLIMSDLVALAAPTSKDSLLAAFPVALLPAPNDLQVLPASVALNSAMANDAAGYVAESPNYLINNTVRARIAVQAGCTKLKMPSMLAFCGSNPGNSCVDVTKVTGICSAGT